MMGISSQHYCFSKPLQNGCYCFEHPLSSDGVSTSLKPTPRVSRCLSVRYDGCCKSCPLPARHGIGRSENLMKAFPVPGHLAGNQPIPRNVIARLAGITSLFNLPYYLWRQQHKTFTRLALQWILVKGFRLYSFQLPDLRSPVLLFIVTTSLN